MPGTPIVVFDGECALCNGFVAWLIRHDKNAVFKVAGSAGDVGKAIVAAAGLEGEVVQSTIVVWDGTRGLTRSDAVLAIATKLGWPWRALGIGRALPRAWRDAVYGAIAQRRARLGAEDPACGVPPAELVAQWRSRLATRADVPGESENLAT
ncbi:thiol-disulfide oxidoreductase DCC family protein [Demequina sp.]|uniref:thiol-disulfide oxidoreductase DCC family protein n=1 Tax=Demequina sp. TaxID=2050685 RepID=UPI003D1419AF